MKKVVMIIWSEFYTEIYASREGRSSTLDKQPPPPPPKLPELAQSDAVIECKVVEKLMDQLNDRLKRVLHTHTDKIVDKVIEVVESKLKITNQVQQGSNPDRMASLSGQPSTRAGTLSGNRLSTQDVRILVAQPNNTTDFENSHHYHPNADTCDHVNQQIGTDKAAKQFGGQPRVLQGKKNHDPEAHRAVEDPNFIITRSPHRAIDKFLTDTDATSYKKVSEHELKRKQDAAEAISIAFKDSRFGGDRRNIRNVTSLTSRPLLSTTS